MAVVICLQDIKIRKIMLEEWFIRSRAIETTSRTLALLLRRYLLVLETCSTKLYLESRCSKHANLLHQVPMKTLCSHHIKLCSPISKFFCFSKLCLSSQSQASLTVLLVDVYCLFKPSLLIPFFPQFTPPPPLLLPWCDCKTVEISPPIESFSFGKLSKPPNQNQI